MMAKNGKRIVSKIWTLHKKGERQRLTSRDSGICSSKSEYLLGIRHTTVAPPLSNALLYHFWSKKTSLQKSHLRDSDSMSHRISGGRFAYSQVSRLSLSMCDPERTVSMSIRRSEPRPSGMQGISSSPSDMGSTGIDSCKVIEEVSPESPEDTAKEDKFGHWYVGA